MFLGVLLLLKFQNARERLGSLTTWFHCKLARSIGTESVMIGRLVGVWLQEIKHIQRVNSFEKQKQLEGTFGKKQISKRSIFINLPRNRLFMNNLHLFR